MNFFNVTLKNGVITDGHGLKLRIPEGKNKVLVEKGYEGKEVIFGIRPEDIHSEQVALEASPEAVVKSEVVVSELLGAETMLYTKTGSTSAKATSLIKKPNKSSNFPNLPPLELRQKIVVWLFLGQKTLLLADLLSVSR